MVFRKRVVEGAFLMDFIQAELTKLLALSIRGQFLSMSVDDKKYTQDYWCKVFSEAKEQGVHTIIYPFIQRQIPEEWFLTNPLDSWKGIIHATCIYQVSNRKFLGKLFEAFAKEKIQFIGLKGLYLQYLYPVPQMRTMSDIDLLINPCDQEKIDQLLRSVGYYMKPTSASSCVQVYKHNKYITLEIHHQLFSNQQLFHTEGFEEKLWNNCMTMNFEGTDLQLPKPINHAVYMLLHMAKHFIYTGFGLRQLADLVLIIEKNELDVNILINEIKVYELECFTKMVLYVVHKLLNFQLPENLMVDEQEYECYLDCFIQEIFKDGLFGKKNGEQVAQHILLNHSNKAQALSIFFPSKNELKDKYWYATQHSFLLPIAWIHRMAYNLFFRKDMKLQEKMSILIKNTTSPSIRLELLKWLSLKSSN